MTQSKPAIGATQPTEGEISDEALEAVDGGLGRAFKPPHAPRSWSDIVTDPDLVVPHDLSPDVRTEQIATNDAAWPAPDAPAPDAPAPDSPAADPAQKPATR